MSDDHDFRVENHGSVFLLRPLTVRAHDWIVAHVADDALWFGRALVVEPRYVENIVDGMTIDGLSGEGHYPF